MTKKLAQFKLKANMSGVRTETRYVGTAGGKRIENQYAVIEGVGHMIRGSVMNGVYYSPEFYDSMVEIMQGQKTQAPNSHPGVNANGEFFQPGDTEYIAHNIGSYDTNWRDDSGVLRSDSYVNLNMIENDEDAAYLLNSISTKSPIDRSTGLYMNVSEESGVGQDGEPYQYKAIEPIGPLDHSAWLNPNIEPGAKTNLEGVGAFTNASFPAMKLPLAKGEFDSEGAMERVKEYTDSMDKPSANFRKFFNSYDINNVDSFDGYDGLFVDIVDGDPMAYLSEMSDTLRAQYEPEKESFWNRLKKLFVGKNKLSIRDIEDKIYKKLNEGLDDVERWPMEIYADNFIYRNEDGRLLQQEYEMVGENVSFVDEPFEVERVVEYKPVNGVNAMRDKILAALAAANVNTDGMDDDALFTAYNEHLAQDKGGEDNPAANLEVLEAVNSLKEQFGTLQAQVNANANKEKDTLVNKVVELDVGIDEDTAKAMSNSALENVIKKNGGTVGFNAATSNDNHNADTYGAMPE